MRPLIILVSFIACFGAQAQLADPGFEQYGTGWSHWCDWEFVQDVPPDGGTVSVRIPVVSGISPDCFVNDDLLPHIHQELPGVQPGDLLQIRFWAKTTPDNPDDAPWMNAEVMLGWLTSPTTLDYDVSSNNYQSTGAPGVWTEQVLQMTCGDIPNGSVPVLFLGGHGFNTSPGVIYLDNVEVDLLSTSVEAREQPSVRFRPNPATDKLWVDLPEIPIEITVVDASGRTLTMRTFHHNAHTLEVEVSSVPTGLCVMLLKSVSGVRMLRFIKT